MRISLLILFTITLAACNRDAVGIDEPATTAAAAAPAATGGVPGDQLNQPELARPNETGARRIGRDEMAPGNAEELREGGVERNGSAPSRQESVRRPASTSLSPTNQAAPTPSMTKLDPSTGPLSVAAISSPEVFTVAKTPCYGDCEQYSLTVYADGLMVLDAKKNLDRSGLFAAVPSAGVRAELLNKFRSATGVRLLTVYPVEEKAPADVPATVLRYPGADGKRQSVKVYADAPAELEELFATVARQVEQADWQRAVK